MGISGHKVLCKETYIDHGLVRFIKNKYYNVFTEFDDSYWIFLSDGVDVYKFYKRNVNKKFDVSYFDDYFDGLKENRRKKLINIFDNKD